MIKNAKTRERWKAIAQTQEGAGKQKYIVFQINTW